VATDLDTRIWDIAMSQGGKKFCEGIHVFKQNGVSHLGGGWVPGHVGREIGWQRISGKHESLRLWLEWWVIKEGWNQADSMIGSRKEHLEAWSIMINQASWDGSMKVISGSDVFLGEMVRHNESVRMWSYKKGVVSCNVAWSGHSKKHQWPSVCQSICMSHLGSPFDQPI